MSALPFRGQAGMLGACGVFGTTRPGAHRRGCCSEAHGRDSIVFLQGDFVTLHQFEDADRLNGFPERRQQEAAARTAEAPNPAGILTRLRHAAQGIVPTGSGEPADGELSFLVGQLIDAATLARAVREAQRAGVSALDVLLSRGWIASEAYVDALARHLDRTRATGPLAAAPAVADRRLAPPATDEAFIAGHDRQGRPVVDGLAGLPGEVEAAASRLESILGPGRLALASPGERRAAYLAARSRRLLDQAVNGLARTTPQLSARRRVSLWQAVTIAALAGLAIGGLIGAPEATSLLLMTLLCLAFLLVVALRLAALGELLVSPSAPDAARRPARIPDAELPVYTVLVPLFKEARVLPGLVKALTRLDYPAAKLDIKLILESVDTETQQAAAALELPGSFEIVIVPDAEPRTKPKALNYAMGLARGTYVVIFDAEDRPEPDQLRLALDAFRAGPANLVCVQGRLNIYNPGQSWITRQFTLEYCALFDAILPSLQRLKLPIPLGGTSNHFRRDVLDEVGGWDPYNVTEDADLGIRLARRGYVCAVIASTTWEEAPRRLGVWVRQRTRWLKGWMQTYLVHLREPARLRRELGWRGFIGFHALLGGFILSMMFHPVCYVLVALEIWRGGFLALTGGWLGGAALTGLALFNLIAGFSAAMALGVVATLKRRRAGLVPDALLMPIYWLLISFAAYRALWQLMVDPHRWEKTEHGEGEPMAPMSAQQWAAPPKKGSPHGTVGL